MTKKPRSRGTLLQPDQAALVLDPDGSMAAPVSQLPRDVLPSPGVRRDSQSEYCFGARREADVLILCVLEEEFNAVLAAFDVNQRKTKETECIFGHRFYHVMKRNKYFGGLNIWFGLIGEARTVVCANFCRDVFEQFRIKHCCLLVGTAAGNRVKVRLGDVVAAFAVFDDAGGSVQPTGVRKRPVPYNLNPSWSELLKGFNPEPREWPMRWDTALKTLKATGARVPAIAEKRAPTFTPGIIVTGEQVRRDDPFPRLVDHYGDQILAIEMEGSGFAATCKEKDINWLIFCGISDYGDTRKGNTWQPVAAFNAGLAARAFLQSVLRPLTEATRQR